MEGDLASYMGTYAPEAGIIPRTLYRLFHILTSSKDEFSVHMSFVELYNEELRDLLSTEPPSPLASGASGLRMYEEKGKGVVLQGLEEIPLTSAEHGLRLLRRGSQQRHIAATRCNESSSRSHCVFTLHVHVKEVGARGEEVVRTGKLNLVDLAGSENIGRSGAENKRAREAGMINQSLLTLGRVINALVEGSSHIPFRESRLTRLLQDSLGGRTKTCIIATVSDDRTNLEETLSTLDYALRAKSIKNRPELNQRMTRGALIKEYVTEIDRLRTDLAATREKNGIYVDADNWAQLEHEREEAGKLTEQLRRSNEVAQSKLASMHEQLEHNTSLLARREAESAAAEALHAERIVELETALAKVTELSAALQEETQQHQARQRNEQHLYEMATSLHRVASTTTSDVDALHAKLQRRAQNEEEARKALVLYYDQLESVCAEISRGAAGAAPGGAAQTHLVHALHTEHTRLRTAVAAELDKVVERLASPVEADPAQLDAELASVHDQLHETVQAAFSSLQFEHAALVESLQTELAGYTDEVHARLSGAVRTASTLAHTVEQRSLALDTYTLEAAKQAQQAAAAHIQRLTDQNAALLASVKQEEDATQRMRTSMLAAMDTYAADQAKRFASATAVSHTTVEEGTQAIWDDAAIHEQHWAHVRTEHEALRAAAVLASVQTSTPAPPALLAPAETYAETLASHASTLDFALDAVPALEPSCTSPPLTSPRRIARGIHRGVLPVPDAPRANQSERRRFVRYRPHGHGRGTLGSRGTSVCSPSIPSTPPSLRTRCSPPPSTSTCFDAPFRRLSTSPSWWMCRAAPHRNANGTPSLRPCCRTSGASDGLRTRPNIALPNYANGRPVIRKNASRYFSEVLWTTSSGSVTGVPALAAWSSPLLFIQSRMYCLSKLAWLWPGWYVSAAQNRDESGVSTSSIRIKSPS